MEVRPSFITKFNLIHIILIVKHFLDLKHVLEAKQWECDIQTLIRNTEYFGKRIKEIRRLGKKK